MLQIFHIDVAKVDGMLHMLQRLYTMLQTSVPNISSVFSDVCCKCVYLDVVYVAHISCKCFISILHMFCNGFFKCFHVFLQMF
jgi:hypothetical protein